MINLPFVQIMGLIATVIVICAFYQKNDVRLKIIMMIGSLTFAVHFYLLGAYAGATVNVINAFLGGFSIRFHKSNKVMFFFIFIYSIIAFFTFEKLISLLPYVTGILGCIALYRLSGIPLRLLILVSSSLWMTYNIIFMSIGGIITEMFVMSVNCITIYRLFKDQQKVDDPHHERL